MTSYIKIPRYNFGNNNHIKKPEGDVKKNYIMREKYYSSFKTISNLILAASKIIKFIHIQASCSTSNMEDFIASDIDEESTEGDICELTRA